MLVQTKEAAELLGLESWQIQSYAKQGFIESVKQTRGAGSRRSYDLLNLVKLTLLKRLTDDGFDLRTIRPIFSGLFESPKLTGGGMSKQVDNIKSWFEDKVLLTCRKFSLRKMVKRERLPEIIDELVANHPGLYLIDLGQIVGELVSDFIALQFNKIGEQR